MSNLKTARQTIEAELRHVKEGIAFYQAKAAALQAALEQIDSAEGVSSRKTRQPRQAVSAGGKAKRGRKPGAKKQDNQGVPRMTRDFWLDFISQQPKSAVEITNAAIASFDPALDQDQAKKVKQRAAQALQALLSTKQIKDVGTGRQRRYFLPLGKSAGTSKQAAKGKAANHTDTTGTVLH